MCRGLRQGQVYAHHVMTGVDHAGGGNRRVDAAAHRGEHPHRETPAVASAACRARATAPGSTRSAASTSDSTLVCPKDNRSDPRALAGSAPIATNTCEGCATPAVQADPVEHSIPLASNNISNASPSHPSNVKCALPGSRREPGRR